MDGIFKCVKITRDAQIKFGIEPKCQACDNGDGERDDEAGTIHARLV